ncbi:unnamed protein product, partial [Meganyctiphanes norvegica]
LFQLTTKCETSMLLMSSHNSKLDQFGIDILPLVDSRSPFPDGAISNNDLSKVRETWEVIEEEGYHGLMTVGKIDVNSLPKNDCRILHQLPQFVNSLIHSLEAYFMFQKPNKAFLPNALNLWEPVENDQTVRFLVLLAWKFDKHPSVALHSSPLIEMKTSPFRGVVESVLAEDAAMEDIENETPNSKMPRSLLDDGRPVKSQKEQMLKGGEVVQTVTKTMSKSPRTLLDAGSPIVNQKENMFSKDREVVRTVTSSTTTTVTKKVLSPKKGLAPVEDESESMETSTFTKKVQVPVEDEIAAADNSSSRRRSAQKTKTTPVAPAGGKRGRRSVAQPPAPVEEEENDPEVSFKVRQPEPVLTPKNSQNAKAAVVTPTATEVQNQNVPMSIDDLELPFEKSVSKQSGGRKSTAGRKSVGGRKSLLPEWPQEEQKEVLTFFDNLNPVQTEATRVNLTCKYGSMLYDRELSSKQFYIWEQKKGREVNKTNQKLTLEESEQKDAVVDFFKALSEAHSEQTRVSFTIKYFQGQYDLAIASKQLYAWLSDKGKKTTKRR